MTTIRRRKAKPRRYEDVSIFVPGVRADLIEREYECSLDPRTDPPTLHRDLLDPLEAGEPVEIPAWLLGMDVVRQVGGGMDVRMIVGTDDIVTVAP